jgi:hypothetical protein
MRDRPLKHVFVPFSCGNICRRWPCAGVVPQPQGEDTQERSILGVDGHRQEEGDRHRAAWVEEAVLYQPLEGRRSLGGQDPVSMSCQLRCRRDRSRATAGTTHGIVMGRWVGSVLSRPALRRRIWMRCPWVRILTLPRRIRRRVGVAVVAGRGGTLLGRLLRVVATLAWVVRRRILGTRRFPGIRHLRHVLSKGRGGG